MSLHPKPWTNDIWLSVRDVIHRTGISESTINRAIAKKNLRVGGTTGKRLFKESWVDIWLEKA